MTKHNAIVGALLFFALLGACERFNSELKIPRAPSAGDLFDGGEKPTCPAHFSQNCWRDILAFVDSCLQDSVSPNQAKFFDDRSLCANDSGRVIAFSSPHPLELVTNKNYQGHLDFLVYSNGNTCFQLRGTATNFKIRTDLGEISVDGTVAGSIKVQCIDGSKFTLIDENLKSACGIESEALAGFLPGVSFRAIEENDKWQGWELALTGNSAQPGQIFKCRF